MPLQLPDPDSEFGLRVVRRLRDEPIAWLTQNPPYLAKYGEWITDG